MLFASITLILNYYFVIINITIIILNLINLFIRGAGAPGAFAPLMLNFKKCF